MWNMLAAVRSPGVIRATLRWTDVMIIEGKASDTPTFD